MNESHRSGSVESQGGVANRSGTTVLVLAIIGGFLSFAVGGCTAMMAEGVADFGDSVSDLQRSFDDYGEAASTSRETAEIRKQAGGFMLYGLLEAVLGIGGGVVAYRNYGSAATATIAGRSFKVLSLAGASIAAAAVLSITNTFAFFTAGVLNTIASVLTFLQAKRV